MPAARRIFPAPRSSRHLHPPSLRPSPLFPCLRAEVGGAPGAFPPGLCAATGSGTAGKDGGKGGSGVPTVTVAGPPPPSVTAPWQQRLSNPGAEGARPLAALSLLQALPATSHVGVFWGPGRPSKHATAFPSRPASNLVGRAGADCSQCSLGRSHRRARGLFLGHAGQQSERTGSASMLATQPTRLETQTKESNTCVSQGLARKPPWCNEGKGCLSRRPRWDPEASPVCRWSTTGLSCPLRWGGGTWSQVLGPERW